MGVSFKVSKIGKRYAPKPIALQSECSPSESQKESSEGKDEPASNNKAGTAKAANSFAGSKVSALSEHDVSFTLNLFSNGYFVGKPCEVDKFQPLPQDLKSLLPYDRSSKGLFSAIETGWLPGDILDDIHCKYVNGAVVCEVRDYRKCIPEHGTVASPVVNRIRLRMSLENIVKDIPLMADDSWTYSDLMEVESRILKALQPKLDLTPIPRLDRLYSDPTIIKLEIDIGSKKRLRTTPDITITQNQAHGKKICIDGVPENANNITGDSGTSISNAAMQHAHEIASSQQLSDVISPSRSNNTLQVPVPDHSKFQPAVNLQGVMQGHGLPTNFIGVSSGISLSQNMLGPYSDSASANVPLHGRRETQDSQLTFMPGPKRARQTIASLDGSQMQQGSPSLAGFNGSEIQWKNQNMHSLNDSKGFQYPNIGVPRFPQMNQEAGASVYFNQHVSRGLKEEQIDSDKLDKHDERSKEYLQPVMNEHALDQQQLRAQHHMQQSSMRAHLPPPNQWNNTRLSVEKDTRRDEVPTKRGKALPSPRVSSGPMVQSPVSSKSGEMSSGSVGAQYSAVAATSAPASLMDKAITNSNAALGAPSVASSPNDSVHRQPQVSASIRRKANSVPRTQTISAVGSPASVSNFNTPLNANSPSIGTQCMVDQVLLDRFSKIEMLTQRYQLNTKNNKVENYPARKPQPHSSQEVAQSLSNSSNSEDFTDPVQTLSKSIRCGNINTCKTRVITFIRPERFYQVAPVRIPSRLIMSEKSYDGTVAMQYGDADDADLISLDWWQTLPTTHYADLLAAQFCSLMDRDGHHKAEDQVFQARTPSVRIGIAAGTPPLAVGMSSENAVSEGRQADLTPAALSNAVVPPNSSGMAHLNTQNLSSNARMLGPGSVSQALSASQGYLPGPGMPGRNQQLEQPQLQQQQQQLQQLQNSQSQLQQQLPLPQIQRSSQVISNNHLSHLMGQSSNIQMGSNTIVNNKPSPMQFQMLQQQQQQSQIPRNMMMGLGTAMGMANRGNSMVGLAGLSNVMGMGGVRGLSSSIGALSGLGNVNPNQMLPTSASSFAAGIRPASMSPTQAAAAAMATKIRMQNRAGIYGTQAGIATMPGNNSQMLPTSGLSMLNHALNRANMSSLQPNTTMASMGPPKISGSNFYMNQQNLQLQHQRLHQQHLQQQQLQQQQLQQQQMHQQQMQQQQSPQMQQQQQQQQQQISSPLQQSQVGSPSVAGSPSPMVMQQQQQQISPQQMSQQSPLSPQQFNSGALQQINNGSITAAPPASPQLSSQTHGSVGSITSSPMEQLQVTNKGASSNV
ncbi:hypothetical protein HPP92_011068 [Vanilla planifolia]|uniref:Uncharacterized protein n=1 Tax=Vanilla planifolia TaxID=51239 RepID=A0A835R248_VANPL|nr:hypothetical protein HPP92_011068 [Vanilla planifolia]